MRRKTGKNKKYYHTPNSNPEKKINFRMVVVFLVALACFGLIFAKLVIVQVVKHSYYAGLARRNIENRKTIPAKRGSIFDRQGREVALDILQYSVGINPGRVKDRPLPVRKISRILDIPVSVIRRKIRENPGFAYLAHRVPPEKALRLRKLKDPRLVLEKRFLRVYPYKENGAHLIGACGRDNQPLSGIEYEYNRYLQGKPGWKVYQKDALGNQLPNPDFAGEDPIDGLDITLTIDMDYQIILEDELKKAAEKSKAQGGVAILLDPNTGEVLALANYPQFDPNQPKTFRLPDMKNRGVADVFEPGSTFKIVPLSAALENLALDLDREIIYCENGRYQLFGKTILDHKKYGWLTLRRVIENSSNIGMMKLARKLPRELFFRYVRNFGFGMITGIDLPGESAGILHPLEKFSRSTHYYMSIGYEIGVTPLQLVNAYAAIANGGKLYRPFVVKKVYGTDHRVLRENGTETIRQVISPETSALITETLRGVVEEGTGKKARVEGLPVAGKTGTAQLYNARTGKYDNRKHVASFVGFFPADNPRFVLLVMIRQPAGAYYGGLVAAPVFRNMARRIYSLASPGNTPFPEIKQVVNPKTVKYIPRVEKLNVKVATDILREKGIKVEVVGKGNKVLRQEEMETDGRITGVRLYLENNLTTRSLKMPRIKGLSLKEALDILASYNLMPSVEGHGVVVAQVPAPGEKIQEAQTVKLICRPS